MPATWLMSPTLKDSQLTAVKQISTHTTSMANPKGKDSYLGPLVLSTMEQVLNPVLVFNLILILIFLIFDF
jgi:hypothetical protein